ncbi:hypothetical protein MASR2M79_03760 [Aminivibrio sp.]
MIVTGGDRLNIQLDGKTKDVLGTGIIEGYGLDGMLSRGGGEPQLRGENPRHGRTDPRKL